MKDCVFCKIVNKKTETSIVYEDDKVAAFLDILPMNLGHTLVIPKVHFENIYDIPEDEVKHLYAIVKKLSIAIKKATKCEGISIIQDNERAAVQEIFHFHTHIIPRYLNDKVIEFPKRPLFYYRYEPAPRKELEKVAEKIRKSL